MFSIAGGFTDTLQVLSPVKFDSNRKCHKALWEYEESSLTPKMICARWNKATECFVRTSNLVDRKREGVVVEHRTPNPEVLRSIPTDGTELCLEQDL